MKPPRPSKKRTPPPSISADDPATQYALDVEAGKIVAGPYVRAACRRHIVDLGLRRTKGLRWDPIAAIRAIGFFTDVLTVEIETSDGESLAVPFVLEPWQCFIIGSLFGWFNADGFRRFRRAYIEVAKGNGKSPMAAGIGHYMLSATGKLRAEIYSAATDKDQAAILFRDAVAMWERSPALKSRLVSSGQNPVWQLTDIRKMSFFKPISSEKKGKSGIRPYCALVDEVHEHSDNSVIEMLRAGTKGNQQALIFEITNSGFDRTSVCRAEHDYTVKVLEGGDENDAWFGFICSLDENDDPFADEDCWIKANPNLGVSIQKPFIRDQVREAQGMPSKEALVRRLHFCEWTDAAQTWIRPDIWKGAERLIAVKQYKGRECYLGLDLSFARDLTALGIAFPNEDGTVDLITEFWTPGDTLAERESRDHLPHLRKWVEDGHINAPPGKIIKTAMIGARIGELMDFCDVRLLAYDRYRHKDLDADLADLGIEPPMIEHPQGFRRAGTLDEDVATRLGMLDEKNKPLANPLWMPSSLEAFENLMIEGKLHVAVNPVMRWNVASAVVRDDPAGTGNRVFDKRRATGRIDGVVAGAMALGAATARFNGEGGREFQIFFVA